MVAYRSVSSSSRSTSIALAFSTSIAIGVGVLSSKRSLLTRGEVGSGVEYSSERSTVETW